jgi:vacuolar-type H+-ATPase subunit E/Vma4
VAATSESVEARREALRLKAAYATSSYAILSGRSPLVQALDLAAMGALTNEVWVEDGRGSTMFGAQAKPITSAIAEIRKRTRSHALRHMSSRELEVVEEMVRAWKKAHPGPVVVEFIRFEAFADEIAAALGRTADLGGMFGRIAGEARSVELLGERALFLISRMPRLAEWHAEAAAANLLAQPNLAAAMDSIAQLGGLQRAVPEQVKVLDTRLAALPAELVAAVAKQTELKGALGQVEQAAQQLKSMETTIQSLERSVAALSAQMGRLNTSTHPDSLRDIADQAGGIVSSRGRSLILLAAGCGAGLLILNAVLRRRQK